MRQMCFILLFWRVFFFIPVSVAAETVVEGVVAVVSLKNREATPEVLFFSDLERYHFFFESPSDDPQAKKRNPADKKTNLLKQLDQVIQQKLLSHEALRFVLEKPTEEEVANHLELIRQRFKDEVAFQKALKRTGLLIQELEEEIVTFLLVEKLIKERIQEFIFISPKAVKSYYLNHAEAFAGKGLEEVEKGIQEILSSEKERMKKNAYLKRMKERAKIEIILK